MKFKGKAMPSVSVLKNSGHPCMLFEAKRNPDAT
jgi:hypothetical protein